MAGYLRNPWVTFLRQYGPVANNDSLYDEHIASAARRAKVRPLRFDTGGVLEELIENFNDEQPRSVVLTGTAGDGKTFLCRELWAALGGDAAVWEGHEKLRELTLKHGARLVVIKDLSELTLDESPLLAPMADAMFVLRPRAVYLVAANDGQLRQAWERVPDSELVVAARKFIDRLLVQGLPRASEAGLILYNLSRQSSRETMTRVVDAVLSHEGWRGCDGCAGQSPDPAARCSIWENRERLGGALFRERLSALLELCDQSERHLPVRQLLILASNMLLGHPDAKDDLLRCQDVEPLARKGRTQLGAIYGNVFGENFPERRRERTAVFDAVRGFGVGEETSNRIDNLLVYGHDDPELAPHFDALLGADAMYGATERFSDHLSAYLEGAQPEKAAGFTAAAVAQRQRLFFTLPPERVDELGLWELTVFQHAGEYLSDVLRPLQRQGGYVDVSLVKRLVRGLNRVFTGMLTSETEYLWLASSGSHSQSRVCRIAEYEVPVTPRWGSCVTVKNHDGAPAVVVHLDRDAPPLALRLSLVRYEFLSRVAEGALPSNFSRECYEDVLSFKSRLLWKQRQLAERDGELGREDTFALRLLRLDDDGRLSANAVNVRLETSR